MTKQEAYAAGHYAFPPPPVCHALWTDQDWINYIDAHGKWLVEITPEKDQPNGL